MAGRFSVEAVFSAVDRMSSTARKMQGRVSRSLQKIDKNMQQVGAVGGKITGVYHKAGLAIAAAGAAAGAVALNIGKTGAEFEQAITNVGAVSLKSRDQIADLEKKALELGATTKFTATEVANGMELMAKAGFENADIMSGIEGVLAAAAASGEDLAETAGTVSNVLKGMGLQTAQASDVADVLALASARTNSTIGSLGESIKGAQEKATQFGIKLPDLTAAVALLQDVGIDASEAGTGMKVMLTKLATATPSVRAKMKNLGVAFEDSKHNMLPLMEVLENFEKVAKGAGGNMKVAALFAELLGTRGQTAAGKLKDLFGTGKIQQLTAELRDASGTAKKMADIKMDTTTGDWLRFGAAVDSVKVALFDTENGPLRKLVQRMTEWVDVNKELIVSGFQDFMAFIRDNGDKIADVLSRVGKAAAFVYGVAVAMKVAAAATWLFNAAVTANPLTLWIVGLTALGALIIAFWPEISAFFGGIADWISEVGGMIWDHLVVAWEKTVEAVTSAFDAIWGVIGPFFTAWAELYVGLWVVAFMAMQKIAGVVMDILSGLGSWLMGWWDTIAEMFAPVAEFFLEVWSGVIDALKWAFQASWDFIKEGFAAVADFFGSLWEPQIEAVKSLADGVIEVFKWAADQTAQMFGFDSIDQVVGLVRSLGGGVLGTRDDDAGDSDEESPGVDIPSPQESVARSVSESTTKNMSEVTIRTEKGTSADMSTPIPGIRLLASGDF